MTYSFQKEVLVAGSVGGQTYYNLKGFDLWSINTSSKCFILKVVLKICSFCFNYLPWQPKFGNKLYISLFQCEDWLAERPSAPYSDFFLSTGADVNITYHCTFVTVCSCCKCYMANIRTHRIDPDIPIKSIASDTLMEIGDQTVK